MGQTQSDEYRADGPTQDVADLEINSKEEEEAKNQDLKREEFKAKQQQHVRKLSNVSHRNIQLLSMKPRSEKETFADDLRTRRRSSLINLILGAPSSGPRFCDDLCSLSSHLSEFGIEVFPDSYPNSSSVSSLRLESIEDTERCNPKALAIQKRRRSSVGSLDPQISLDATTDSPPGVAIKEKSAVLWAASNGGKGKQTYRRPSLASTLASIDLSSSFDLHEKSGRILPSQFNRPPLCKTKQTIFESVSQESINDLKTRLSKGRVNQVGRALRRTGSELSLYSTISAGTGAYSQRASITETSSKQPKDAHKETKLIIILQVCLPFILAGFGNMAAGLVLNRVAHWRAFHQVPIFFVLLPPLVGLKGNIEMTLASRLSTLSNLNLLDTGGQKKRAYASNLVLILSQAISLSVFASFSSILCEYLMGGAPHGMDNIEFFKEAALVVVASALLTSALLVVISSVIMSLAVGLASLIQVNPDNLSTLIAALYGDVSCVLVYGLIADWMFSLKEQNILIWPLIIIGSALFLWPILLFVAYKFKETRNISLSSMPPMLSSIVISMGSGAVLSMVIGRFKLVALYQPVVNGFSANLIAVQASRVSTWLWCSALREMSISAKESAGAPTKALGSLTSFIVPDLPSSDTKPKRPSLFGILAKFLKIVLWSFCNSSPNSVAAKLLLIMLIPAHTIYFFVIWSLSPAGYVVITWPFYLIYITLCLFQVSLLLTICEPLMTLLMHYHLDPDIFGISMLMALADLTGTLCLTGAFFLLSGIGDVNAN